MVVVTVMVVMITIMMLNHDHDCDDHMKPFKVYLAQDVKHGFVALKTVDSQRMGVVSLKFNKK